MPANGSRGSQFQAVAKTAAATAVPLLLGAAAMALILDSGTVQLPPLAPGSRPAAPPTAAKIIVAPPASHTHGKAAATGTSGSTPALNSGGAAGAGGSTPASLSRGAGRATGSTAPSHSSGGTSGTPSGGGGNGGNGGGGGGSGGGGGGGGGGGSGGGSGGPPPPPTQPPPPPTIDAVGTHHGLALGHAKNHVPQGPALPALSHRNHVPPGQARKQQQDGSKPGPGDQDDGQAPPSHSHDGSGHHSHGQGQSFHRRDHTPPGQAHRGHHGHLPPGHARKAQSGHIPPGQARKAGGKGTQQGAGDPSENQTPPGQEGGGNGNGSHGRGHGH